MEIIKQNLRLELVRPDLWGLPAPQWPAGFSLRWFKPGDACHWLRIHHDAEPFDEISPEIFLREFGSDFPRLAQCQGFLQDENGRVIGTGTAWDAEDETGGKWGRVFWLAVLRQHQGRGLGRPLLAAICQRLQELGHSRARVTTSTGRPSAVILYLHFGFQPVVRTAVEQERWNAMLGFLRQNGRLPPAGPPHLSAPAMPLGNAAPAMPAPTAP